MSSFYSQFYRQNIIIIQKAIFKTTISSNTAPKENLIKQQKNKCLVDICTVIF